MSKQDYQAVYTECDAAGRAAAEACTPTPMIVQQRASVLDDSSPVVQEWEVSGGVCGFAWVSFKGNTGWARWTKKHQLCRADYPSGRMIWVRDYGQSMERKYAYARAFANKLREFGVRAYANSRMD